ncbi:MAG: MarR family transcriptional regulator [Lachnospiraceae bacterium]|nr:MarR family transcriptional regulator [Lachnospiraceae bacterium]
MQGRFETFTVLIAKINRNIRKIKNEEMSEYNLRSSHISCLYYLYISEKLTSTELCEKCEEDKATISRSIDYLEKNGFITCGEKNIKRYRSPILLTEKGKEAGAKITDKINKVLDEVSDGLTENEREELYKNLTMISDRLNAITNRLTNKK